VTGSFHSRGVLRVVCGRQPLSVMTIFGLATATGADGKLGSARGGLAAAARGALGCVASGADGKSQYAAAITIAAAPASSTSRCFMVWAFDASWLPR